MRTPTLTQRATQLKDDRLSLALHDHLSRYTPQTLQYAYQRIGDKLPEYYSIPAWQEAVENREIPDAPDLQAVLDADHSLVWIFKYNHEDNTRLRAGRDQDLATAIDNEIERILYESNMLAKPVLKHAKEIPDS